MKYSLLFFWGGILIAMHFTQPFPELIPLIQLENKKKKPVHIHFIFYLLLTAECYPHLIPH